MAEQQGPVGVQIGASPEAIREARASINDILSTQASGRTTRLALRAFTEVCKVSNVHLDGFTITMPASPAKVVDLTDA
jgi:hypothetical protein